MIKLRYIGDYQPKGMIVEVEEKDLKAFLKNGEYEELIIKPIIKKEVKYNDNNSK